MQQKKTTKEEYQKCVKMCIRDSIYSFRILNARQQYIRVTSRHQVLKQDHNGKAWLVIGNREYVFKASSKLTYFPTVVKLNTIRTIKI